MYLFRISYTTKPMPLTIYIQIIEMRIQIKRNTNICVADSVHSARENAQVVLASQLEQCQDGEIVMCKYYKNGVDDSDGINALFGLSNGTIIDNESIELLYEEVENIKTTTIPDAITSRLNAITVASISKENEFISSIGQTSGYVTATTSQVQSNQVGYNGSTVKDKLDKVQDKIKIINESSTSKAIQPDTYYNFGEVSSLNITLAAPADASCLSEYMFQFSCGGNAATLSLPSSVKWSGTNPIVLLPNKVYQVTIVNNLAVWAAYAK